MFAKLLISILSPLMLHSLLCSSFCFRDFQSEPSKTKGQPTQKGDKPVKSVNSDPAVEPVFLSLRKLLYTDVTLKEMVEEIPEKYKSADEFRAQLEDYARAHPEEAQTPEYKQNLEFWGKEKRNPTVADAVQLIRKGQYKQAVALLESDAKKRLSGKADWDYYLALAYAKQQAGDIEGACNSLRESLNLPDMESRSLLYTARYFHILGAKMSDEELNRVYGVIVEIGIKNTVITVGGFSDGESRLFFGNGNSAPIGGKDSFPEDTRMAAKMLTSVAQQFSGKLPLDNSHPLPKQGMVRIVLLTAGGAYATEESLHRLEKGGTQFDQVWMSANGLINFLLNFMSATNKK